MKTRVEVIHPEQRAFLGAILKPTIGCAEVRVLKADSSNGHITKGVKYKTTYAGWFDDPAKLAREASRVRGVSAYITINPVTSALLSRADLLYSQSHTTTDDDIVCLSNVFIDIDPKRPADISATEEERAAALVCRDKILADHPTIASSACWGCSGNGQWILVRIPDLPNDRDHRKLVDSFLKAMAARYSGEYQGVRCEIDPAVGNPARIMALVGTMKCKGISTADRPHRLVTQDSPLDRARSEFDLIGWLALHAPAEEPGTQQTNGAAHSPNSWTRTVPPSGADVESRAIAYIATIEPAIEGQKGSNPTFRAACAVGPGFDLSEETTVRLLLTHYSPRCAPHWTESEMRHKVADAFKKESRRGWLLNDSSKQSGGARGSAQAAANGTAKIDLSWVTLDLATLADAAKELEDTAYAWDLWIPRSSITAIVAPPGVGKTRLVAEWCKRFWFKELMPDGIASSFAAQTKALWLCYDRNWRGLIRSYTQFGAPMESALLPARRGKALCLPDFDKPETMDLLRHLIKVHNPGLVVIDTTTYASAFNTGKPNEAKIAYDPIMDVLMETKCPGLGLTHTNNEGGVLNKRFLERCRVRIDITRPDPACKDRLRIEVTKSDDKIPPPLGATFTDTAVVYDTKPPEAPDTPKRGRKPTTSPGLAEFLWEYLQTAPAFVVDIIKAARDKGLLKASTDAEPSPSISPLYNARDWVARQHPGKTIDQFEMATQKGRMLKAWQILDASAVQPATALDPDDPDWTKRP